MDSGLQKSWKWLYTMRLENYLSLNWPMNSTDEAVFLNVFCWPNFPVRAIPVGWATPEFQRQVSGRNRYYRNLLYESSLTGGSRPFPVIQR